MSCLYHLSIPPPLPGFIATHWPPLLHLSDFKSKQKSQSQNGCKEKPNLKPEFQRKNVNSYSYKMSKVPVLLKIPYNSNSCVI